MEGTARSWSDIPLDLAGLVLCRLPAHIDRVRFAIVCTQWRSAMQQVPLPLPLPLLALKDGTFYSMPRGELLRFPGCDNGFITATGNWLVYNRLHCLLLVDPFSGATMTLPSRSNEGVRGSDDDDESALTSVLDIKGFAMVKLIVCSPYLIAALFCSGCSCRIAVCRPGASSWSVAPDLSLSITDMAFYQGKLYGVNNAEDLLALDISLDDSTGDPQVAHIGHVIKGTDEASLKVGLNFRRMLYLVESRGSLLMVRRRIFHTHIDAEGQIHSFAGQCEPELAVFEACFVRSRWDKVIALEDDQVLFLGLCSRAFCMPQHDLMGKRVWFLDDYKTGSAIISMIPWPASMANRKFSSPLPLISWSDHNGRGAAAWLFPSN